MQKRLELDIAHIFGISRSEYEIDEWMEQRSELMIIDGRLKTTAKYPEAYSKPIDMLFWAGWNVPESIDKFRSFHSFRLSPTSL